MKAWKGWKWRVAFGAVLLLALGFCALTFTHSYMPGRDAAGEWIIVAHAHPSTLVLGLALALAAWLCGVQPPAARPLELLPALALGGVGWLLSDTPLLYGVIEQNKGIWSMGIYTGFVLGLLLIAFCKNWIAKRGWRGFALRAALPPLVCVAVCLLAQLANKGLLTAWMHSTDTLRGETYHYGLPIAASILAALAAAASLWPCVRASRPGGVALLSLGAVGVAFWCLNRFVPIRLSQMESFWPRLLEANSQLGVYLSDALTLYLMWMVCGLKGLRKQKG